MSTSRKLRQTSWLLLPSLLALTLTRPAFAYKPTSPEVQALAKGGVSLIEREVPAQAGGNQVDLELGGYCICALACFTYHGDREHPVVRRAIHEIRDQLQKGIPDSGHANYSLGIALILLGSLDPAAYLKETKAILELIYARQLSGGAWSYPGYQTGDTSQTQFACLGMWMAHRQDIEVPIPVVDRVTNWLLRTQAPDGAFGYQGKDPGNFTRVAQERTTKSMGVAGTGTLYVCGELLGFFDPDLKQTQTQLNLPPGVKPVKKRKTTVTTTVDLSQWRAAVADGDNWVSRNSGPENILDGAVAQQYYYMYTVERYWAFRELGTKNVSAEPSWYNQGVDYLKKTVAQDGSWKSENAAPIDTAFAVLFLLRGSQKTIQRIVELQGRLVGGRDLPTDPTNVKQDSSGRIVSKDAERNIEAMLAALEDPNSAVTSDLDDVAKQLAIAVGRGAEQADRLRRMAIGGPYLGRITAVKALSRVRDLDNAPALIYALTDPDIRVGQAALDGLQFLSRRLDGPKLSDEANAQQKAAVAAVWKEWFLSIRPDGVLIE
jgi:hypothetical protein